nr:unnamed protein product [Callosobruchus analis]
MYKFPLFLPVLFLPTLSHNYSVINLPEGHLQYFFRNLPHLAHKCSIDDDCPFKQHLNKDRCWGYEYDCDWTKQYSIPACPGDHRGWVKSKFAQQTTFHIQADFGYVKEQIKEMKMMCVPLFPDDSSLECSEHLRFCRGRNIMINFTKLAYIDEPIRYKMDVLERLLKEADHISPLQSWGPELRYFAKLKRRPIVEGDCDVVVEKPTFVMKIDATVNMYHHYCDFLNLYASLHVNSTDEYAFSTDVHVLIWESFDYRSAFGDTWQAFTEHPVWNLKTFKEGVNKRAHLLYSLSEEAYLLLSNLCMPNKPDETPYENILQLLTTYYGKTAVTWVERQKFYSSAKLETESALEWIVRLKGLARYCNFGEQLETKLTDIFITNYNPGKVRTELFGLSDSTTLNNAIEKAKIIEATLAIREQVAEIKSEPVESDVFRLTRKNMSSENTTARGRDPQRYHGGHGGAVLQCAVTKDVCVGVGRAVSLWRRRHRSHRHQLAVSDAAAITALMYVPIRTTFVTRDTVCFKNIVFPLLPRMIFGLYYNTPIIYGCEKSGLFDAFSKHILHRLKIPLHPRKNKRIRITLLSRNTKYRRIVNEEELLKSIKKNDRYEVKRAIYDRDVPFKKQLEITRNSDIFIGIHGAGLTHLMFLPPWAVLFELLRGVKYITWQKSDKLKSFEDGTYVGGAHAKFANYSFDVEEFSRLVNIGVTHVRNHPEFNMFLKKALEHEKTVLHDEL